MRCLILGIALYSGCASPRATSTAAVAADPPARIGAFGTASVESSEMLLDGPIYGLCGMLSFEVPSPEVAIAFEHFNKTSEHNAAGLKSAVGTDYLLGALALRGGEAQADPTIVYNRRVAYANAVNTWLSAGLVEEARGALLQAATGDNELGQELRLAAQQLPEPMSCSPATGSGP